MAYTVKDYPTKKALIADFKAGAKIQCYQPGGMFPLVPGHVCLEGPHYPKPHKWYANGIVDKDLCLTSVK